MSDENQSSDRDRLVVARLEQISATGGIELSQDQTDQLLDKIARLLDLGAKVRSTPMTNGDEPEIVFAPYRREATGS